MPALLGADMIDTLAPVDPRPVLISIVGPPASGKSWLRERLAESLALPSFAIDDERERLTKGPGHGYSFTHDDAAWSNLARRLRDEPAAIVETAGTAARYQVITAGRRVLTIECEASPRERLRRLEERVRARYFLTLHQGDYAQRLVAIQGGAPGALVVDTLDPASVDRAVVAARAFVGDAPPPATAAPIRRAALLSTLAPVDRLRALPYPLAVATLARLEATHGPEAVASLRYSWPFWARPAQRVDDLDNLATIEVFVGERRSGKTRAAVELFVSLVRTGRARLPRIVSATDPAIVDIAIDGASGIRSWLPPPVTPAVFDFKKSDGYAGTLLLYGTKVVCCSAAAPGQAIGMSRDCTLVEDPAGWVESVGEKMATDTWIEVQKSNSEGISTLIVATTPEGADFLTELLSPEQRSDPRYIRIHDLGVVENNRGNLAPNYLRHTVADLRRKSKWGAQSTTSPFAHTDFPRLRLAECPPLIELAVAIDPSRTAGQGSCEVGIVGGGKDDRGVVHVRRDVSAILDAGVSGWPAVAWELAEELRREHPGVPLHFVLESNTGSNNAELLRSEERSRRKAKNNITEVVVVRAGKNKCERARLPAMQAGLGQVRLAPGLTVLEGQLRNLTPDGKKSDHADAMVHLVRNLADLSDEKEIAREATALEEAEAVQAQALYVAGVNAKIAAMRSGTAPKPAVMPVEGAPPGDARYAGPPARVMVRPQSWRSRGVL